MRLDSGQIIRWHGHGFTGGVGHLKNRNQKPKCQQSGPRPGMQNMQSVVKREGTQACQEQDAESPWDELLHWAEKNVLRKKKEQGKKVRTMENTALSQDLRSWTPLAEPWGYISSLFLAPWILPSLFTLPQLPEETENALRCQYI